MSHDYNNPEFKKLLQKLQEESWQLELLISGFAIFGLFTAIEPFELGVEEANNTEQIYKLVISLVGLISSYILIFNLLLHVLLRGLWIGALGLRYVSGDIDYESLKYSKLFTNYLQKRVGSFDKYIATLENYCSVIFAISFLLIFYVLAITFTIIVIALLGSFVIGNDDLPGWLANGVGITVVTFLGVGMFLAFIDFITLGFLKKKKWISYIYFPVYWVFSFITLSFLYRPLVYNFLDNKFGRRLSMSLIPFYLLIIVMTSFKYNTSNFLYEDNSSDDYVGNKNNYIDSIEEEDFIDVIAIQSKVITDPYLKVFVAYSESIENRIFNYNPGLEPEDDQRGLKSQMYNDFSFRNRDSLGREYIKTFNYIYSVAIDTVKFDSDFIMSTSKNNELGFETYLPTSGLEEGRHLFRLSRKRIKDGDTLNWTIVKIPFWYYENQ